MANDDKTFIETARRAQIVTAAIATIAAEGYSRTSFIRIAARAGISPGLITYHFKTKDHLIKEVLAHVDANLNQAMSANDDSVTSYAQALEQIITGFVRHCAQNPEEMSALRRISSAEPSPALAQLISTRDTSGATELIDFLVEAQQYEFREFNPEIFARTLFAAMQDTPRHFAQNPDLDPESYARELSDLFVQAAVKR